MEDPLDFKEDIQRESAKFEDSLESAVPEDTPNDTKNLLMLIGIVIGLFVLFFVGGYFYSRIFVDDLVVDTIDNLHLKNIQGEPEGDNYVYNGYSFVFFDNLWYTQVQRGEDLVDIPLHFSPKDLIDVPIGGQINETFKKNNLFVTFNPTENDLKFVALSTAELSSNLASGLGVAPIAACDRNETLACSDRPIITCDNEDNSVIHMMQEVNATAEVAFDDNCVQIKGDGWELVKATDRFLLKLYQIME